jgi:hypothetical protein
MSIDGLSLREFDFDDAETARIKIGIETSDQYGATADGRWLEPLLVALWPSNPTL